MGVKPHADYEQILAAVARVAGRFAGPWSGVGYRYATVRYANPADFLSGQGSLLNGGRWNAPGAARAVYLSLDVEDATAEYFARYRRAGLTPRAGTPCIVRAADIEVGRCLDLTDGEVRRSLQVSAARMMECEWEQENHAGREAFTQAIGRAAIENGLDALLTPSAAAAHASNVVVFPEALGLGSRFLTTT